MDGLISSPLSPKPTRDLKQHRLRQAVDRLAQAFDVDPQTKRQVPMHLVVALLAIVASAMPAYSQEIDWQKVDASLGRKPAAFSGVFIVTAFPGLTSL